MSDPFIDLVLVTRAKMESEMQQDVQNMTALDCLNEMRNLGRPERADSWEMDLRDTSSWDEHAKMVQRLRRDLKDVRHYVSNPPDPMAGRVNYDDSRGA